jgi:hypothetical protein
MLRSDSSQITLFIVVAAVLRVGLYLAFPGRVHADETFQYIEQGNRLLGQPGIVPWEFAMGVRSWVLPAIVAGVLWSARRLSGDPLFAIQMVSVVFAFLSLVGVVLGYRFGQAKGGRAAAIACACLNATTVELIYFAPHPLPDTIAAPLLFGGLYMADLPGKAPCRRRFAMAGLLFGCCLVLRVQIAPAIAVGMLWSAGRQIHSRLVPLILGAAVPLALSGLLDWATWGRPFQSIWLYFWVNSVYGASDLFGTSPWYHYLAFLLSRSTLFLLPLAGLAMLGGRRAPVLGLVALTILGTFSLVGHKEFRFLYPAFPLIATLVGLGSVDVAGFAVSGLAGKRIEARSLGFMLALFWAGMWALAGVFGPARSYWYHGTAVIESMRIVDGDPVACGIAVDPADKWGAGGGYVALRPGIRLFGYRPDADRRQTDAFDYVYSTTDRDFTPYGFVQLRCWQRQSICLWRRPGDCDPEQGKPVVVTQTPG